MTTDPEDAAPLPAGWHLIPPEALGTAGIVVLVGLGLVLRGLATGRGLL